MNYEEAVKIWAAKNIFHKVKPSQVIAVDFALDNLGSCPTCDYPVPAVKVTYQNDVAKPRSQKFETIELEGSFAALIREIVRAGEDPTNYVPSRFPHAFVGQDAYCEICFKPGDWDIHDI